MNNTVYYEWIMKTTRTSKALMPTLMMVDSAYTYLESCFAVSDVEH